jgi:hypothetical protein
MIAGTGYFDGVVEAVAVAVDVDARSGPAHGRSVRQAVYGSPDASAGQTPVHRPMTPPARQTQLFGQALLPRGMMAPSW